MQQRSTAYGSREWHNFVLRDESQFCLDMHNCTIPEGGSEYAVGIYVQMISAVVFWENICYVSWSVLFFFRGSTTAGCNEYPTNHFITFLDDIEPYTFSTKKALKFFPGDIHSPQNTINTRFRGIIFNVELLKCQINVLVPYGCNT